jgi:PAS domain S-box-containing protein
MLSINDYKAIYDASPDGMLVIGEDGRIRSANPRIEDLFGWSPEELSGREVEILIPEALRSGHVGHRDSFRANPRSRPMGMGLDLEGQHKDGSTFPVEVSLSPWTQPDGKTGVICAVRDITAYRRLRDFSEGALRASEEERKRIARELHDDTAQRLATLILRVRTVAGTDGPEERMTLFEEVRAEIVDAADSVRRMSRGLRPPELEELGLAHALQAHARTLEHLAGFDVAADLEVVDRHLDQTGKLALYRIVQEALSNARRHSGVDSARVSLRQEGEEIVAEVVDEGRGFTPSFGEAGLGLIGMHERASMIGGRLAVETAPGKGTKITLKIPIKEARLA